MLDLFAGSAQNEDQQGPDEDYAFVAGDNWKVDTYDVAPFGDAKDKGFGIRFLRHPKATPTPTSDVMGLPRGPKQEHANKVLEYSDGELEQFPWLTVFGGGRAATVFAFPSVVRGVLFSFALSTCCIPFSLTLEKCVMETLSSVLATVSAGLFFLLGPYVGMSVARWWQMRMDLLGGVWGAIADLNNYASLWFNSGSAADVKARTLLLRYGVAAHSLLYKDARGHTSLDDVVARGTLLPEEAELLVKLPSKSQMVFEWIAEFWRRALSEDSGGLGTSPVPHAPQQAPAIYACCLKGRGAAGGALALVFTQIPFPYVHLLSIMVQVACNINAVVQGTKTGWMLSEPVCTSAASAAAYNPDVYRYRYEAVEGCPPAIFVYSYSALAMLLFGWATSILVYPIVYNGLLTLGVMLSNPLGTDVIDFPGSFYEQVLKAEVRGFFTCSDSINQKGGAHKWWQLAKSEKLPRTEV